MSKTEECIKTAERYGAHNYLPLPIVLNRGEGSFVWDVDGKKYIDFLSSYSALNFGHKHPKIMQALHEQSQKLAVCSRAFHSEMLSRFVEKLSHFCGMEAVLPMNSGTEAVETALKIARKWGHQKGISDGEIIAMENNFHGRSITVISFSSEKVYREGFSPFTPGFKLVPFGDVKALEKAFTPKTIAVLLEPIQAESGIRVPPLGYLSEVAKLCRKKNALFLLDEIQTGLGRTGKDFCFQHENCPPDILILGKSLGGGLLPLSAAVCSRKIMDVIGPGEHGSTFGGNPLACAVGIAAIDLLTQTKLSLRSETLGKKVAQCLQGLKAKHVKNIRGQGLLWGIELDRPARPYCEKLAQEGVLCKETHETVIRIAPPLVIEEKVLIEGIEKIISIIQDS